MNIEYVLGTINLFLLGFLGWTLFSMLHIPAPAMLGSLVVVGTLRLLNFPLISSPDFLPTLVQIIIGYIAGSGVTRDKARELKSMMAPASIIVIWSISMIFILSFTLTRLTFLDAYTAILSSSMGGLPEMTLIALAVGAETSVVAVIHTLRIVVTLAIFPLLAEKFETDYIDKIPNKNNNTIKCSNNSTFIKNIRQSIRNIYVKTLNIKSMSVHKLLKSWAKTFLILCAASIGGFLISSFGVPAGVMVGSMLTVSIISLTGVEIKPVSSNIVTFILIGTGIMVADNVSAKTVEIIVSDKFIMIILISTILIFLSSFFVAYLINKITGWDKLTCFLSAAPGGFTVIATLAIDYEKDPFAISILHLCRLIVIKTLVPIVFALIT
ncbi:MAG TPA: AbrB family transcriptional regulator [Thermoanaerobacterales bacterium]|jgi:membrane AbrB-like protein|nr:AbrB family transcriptional regulator [Thermoanaerobacterales bacterium]